MSNYERLVNDWRLKFLEMDKERLIRTIPGLELAGEYLTLSHFGRRFGVHGDTGHIASLCDDEPVPSYTKLNIYTLFGYAKPGARILGDFVAFQDLQGALPFKRAFDQSILHPIAETFSGNESAFARACEKLGGRKLPGSGTKFEIDAFLCMPVRFLFWDGDEEFPAQANLLFDRSATDFIHVESVVTVASEGMFYLAEAAGLELKGSPLFRP